MLYIATEVLILLVTLYSLYYMYTRLRHDRWYTLHALPLLLYSVHVAIYYLAVIARRVFGLDIGVLLMPWSLALRLHGALMVMQMARTVVLCCRRN
jgi:hypothetical protein